MSILVNNGGLLTTVQDTGRYGRQQFGVSVSGAMDAQSLRVANILVGNAWDEAGLEATILGPTLEFREDNVIAVTGGDLSPALNDNPLPMYRAVTVRKGNILRFGTPVSGSRAYIAFAGGLEIESYMGSKSTYLRGVFGGLDGRKLQPGDIINFLNPKPSLPNMAARFADPEKFFNDEITLRVVLGPQDDYFSEKGIATFFSAPYHLTKDCDRMGARLDGEALEHSRGGTIISDGINYGSIQVPPDGKPIMMLADRQSTGGYSKIACVISADHPLIAQAKPGMTVKFKKVSIEEAQDLYVKQIERLQTLEKTLNHEHPHQNLIRTFSVKVNHISYAVTVEEVQGQCK